MTKIKLCGISRMSDIEIINKIRPEYIGFVFYEKSSRYVTPDEAKLLKENLSQDIRAVGVFVDEDVAKVASLLNEKIIDIAQLHGCEDEKYISELKRLSGAPIIKAFQIKTKDNINVAEKCSADHVLLDSGTGSGCLFDWSLIKSIKRPFFLAGGLNEDNIKQALDDVAPYAVDVSSGIETDGVKDEHKMKHFVDIVRESI